MRDANGLGATTAETTAETARHGASRPRAARGFSMIELLVAIGVILVLLGLIVPVLGRSVDQARLTADLAAIRSNAAAVFQYVDQNEGLYPLGANRRCGVARSWFTPLIETGYLSSASDADPRSHPKWGIVTFYMSQSLGADPQEFTWGYTQDCSISPSRGVGQHLVEYPSAKGLMVKHHDPEWDSPDGIGARWFCCVSRWTVPVSFCDGSAQFGDHMTFAPGGRPPVVVWEHNVGMPILSPWGGYRARER